MRRSARVLIIGMAIAAMFTAGDALAAGKAGLWSITTTMNFGAGMPQMPQMTPEQLAQMQRMGIQMPAMPGAQPIISQTCVTPDQAAAAKPPTVTREADKCTMQNLQTTGRTFSADMICTGDMNGKGAFKITYDTEEHYLGSMDFMGTAQGRPANMKMTFEGKWLKADCAN
jgi:hypothetical protein